jgi:outer membrane protein TolC
MHNLRRIIEAQKKNIEFANEGVRIAMLRYERGNGTNFEVMDSQTALTVSESEYFQSIQTYISDLAELGAMVSDDPRELLNLALTHDLANVN